MYVKFFPIQQIHVVSLCYSGRQSLTFKDGGLNTSFLEEVINTYWAGFNHSPTQQKFAVCLCVPSTMVG